ncbi:hypothetical protein IGB42_03988 [Andreprevotia sp. IGB-42]|uniref:ankyrin repeat domain-containing protein n=1 Tax=Andreprevotia sp. IGB-42 TaxID=2497473 RepID=UPI00135BCA84|nr:ankyrin repeat domain-containing protein [Andreprevotia sp. IGB-42]KAF0811531.1 hypothetical protein IGB42_03988 [Andreprevotia sp. IGB-42]
MNITDHQGVSAIRRRAIALPRVWHSRLQVAVLLLGLLSPVAHADCTNDPDPWLTLSVAARTGEQSQLACLLKRLGVNNHDPKDLWENTPLHLAARYDQATMVEALLAAGARIDQPNAASQRPLKVAISAKASDSAAALILAGADIEAADDEGRTPLFWAVAEDDVSIANLLLQKGANAERVFTSGEKPSTIRQYAQRRGNPAMLKLFAAP